MSKRDWLYAVVIPLLLTWSIDRVTKIWAMGLQAAEFFGPNFLKIGFTLHYNPGAILGLFADLPPVLRIVSLSTGGAFLIFTFLIIQILLPVRSIPMRAGMSILLGGILGNVSDRIAWGHVVDFILFATPTRVSPVFNMADALQWVGYFMIVYALLKEGKNIWPENNLRKSYWVNPKFQLRYCAKLIAFGFAFAIIAGTYSYTFLKISLAEVAAGSSPSHDHILIPFVITFVIISIAFISILFFTGMVLSNRSAGPLYAFERFLEDMFRGKYRPLKLRAGDEFVHLEDLADRMASELAPHFKEYRERKDEEDEASKSDVIT